MSDKNNSCRKDTPGPFSMGNCTNTKYNRYGMLTRPNEIVLTFSLNADLIKLVKAITANHAFTSNLD